MSLSKEQQIFTRHISRLILYATGLGIGLTFGDAYRPKMLQYLYFYGYTIRMSGVIPKLIRAKKRSKTLNSNHKKRLAVDFNFFIDGKLIYKHKLINALGQYWEGLDPAHNRWGGNFKNIYDSPHFERNIKI